jgi:hypothetical protein
MNIGLIDNNKRFGSPYPSSAIFEFKKTKAFGISGNSNHQHLSPGMNLFGKRPSIIKNCHIGHSPVQVKLYLLTPSAPVRNNRKTQRFGCRRSPMGLWFSIIWAGLKIRGSAGQQNQRQQEWKAAG